MHKIGPIDGPGSYSTKPVHDHDMIAEACRGAVAWTMR
jgi:hypothetical protein